MKRCSECGSEVHEDSELAVDEAWLRAVGFEPKRYQGETNLALSFKSPTDDPQWIQTGPATISHGLFLVCRWSSLYDDDTPPDRIEIKAKTRGDVRLLARALGIQLTERPQ